MSMIGFAFIHVATLSPVVFHQEIAWSAWKPISSAKQIEYRFRDDQAHKGDYGAPAFVQVRNKTSNRLDLDILVQYSLPRDMEAGITDYTIAVKLSPGEESTEKALGSIDRMVAIRVARSTPIADAAVTTPTKDSANIDTLLTTQISGVLADANAKAAKLQQLRTQIVADSDRLAATYRKISLQDAQHHKEYTARLNAVEGFAAQIRQAQMQNAQTLLSNHFAVQLPGTMSPLAQMNMTLRQYNPQLAEVNAYFDVAHALTALNAGQTRALDQLQGATNAIGAIAGLFGSHKDPEQERQEKLRQMERTKKNLERLQKNYDRAKEEADPTIDGLVEKAGAGDLDGVQAVLDPLEEVNRKILVNRRASNGDTPLALASTVGDLKMIKLLSSAGAEVNAVDPEGRTALLRATGAMQTDAVLLLISLGADKTKVPDAKIDGQPRLTALELAKKNRDRRTILAVEGRYKVASVDKRVSQVAAYAASGNAPQLALLISDSNPNIRDEFGWTPLHHAVAAGQVETVQALLDAKASVTALTRTGRSPLTLAVEKDQPLVAYALMRAGADPKARDGNGEDALSLAKTLKRDALSLILAEEKKK